MTARARLTCALGAVAVALSVAGAPLAATPASAAAPDAQGWWWAPGSSTAVTAPVAPPDVPADGLYVQGGVGTTSPGAYAAVVYLIPAGATITGPLTLTVAAGSATTVGATLEACPLLDPTIHAEQGGPASDAPAYDCRTHAQATLAPGGTTFSVPVAGLASHGALAVALLPGAGAERVVLDRPGSSSLDVSAPASSGTSFAPGGAGSGGAGSGGAGSGGAGSGGAGAVTAAPGGSAGGASVPAAPDRGSLSTGSAPGGSLSTGSASAGSPAPSLAGVGPGPASAASPATASTSSGGGSSPPVGSSPGSAVSARAVAGSGAGAGPGAGSGTSGWAAALFGAGVVAAVALWGAASRRPPGATTGEGAAAPGEGAAAPA